MNYCTRITRESKLLEADGVTLRYPGVKVVIKKMNERRRVNRELTMASSRQKVNEQTEALQKALKEKDGLPPGELDRLNATFGELLHGEWYPAWIRWGLASIEGLTIDDAPATIDSLCEVGPSDLVEEIFLAVIEASGLSTQETKNSASPGTSEGQADGKTSDSTATAATPSENGEPATAPNSTPAT